MRTRVLTDRGSVAMFAIAVLAVLVTVAMAVAAAVGAVVAQGRARAAADLSALAGAQALRQGADACAIADRRAQQNGARVETCRVEGASVRVRVSVAAGWEARRVGAEARAGPA